LTNSPSTDRFLEPLTLPPDWVIAGEMAYSLVCTCQRLTNTVTCHEQTFRILSPGTEKLPMLRQGVNRIWVLKPAGRSLSSFHLLNLVNEVKDLLQGSSIHMLYVKSRQRLPDDSRCVICGEFFQTKLELLVK